jgi:hypothetical protein
VPKPADVGVELVPWNEAGADPAGDRPQLPVADQGANLVLGDAELGRDLADGQWLGPVHARTLRLGAVLDLASRLRELQVPGGAPWPGHEYVRGWGVFGLPFDSGHVLALRVFPDNDFAPDRTLWHRDPAGRWSIHVDGPRIETAAAQDTPAPARAIGALAGSRGAQAVGRDA